MRRPFLAFPVLAVTVGLALSACAESPTSLTTVDQSVSFARRGETPVPAYIGTRSRVVWS